MAVVSVQALPFNGFRWQWASVQPTEGLNKPSVFLGVLRVFNEFEGSPPSSLELAERLRYVGQQTDATLDLARTPERNLIRNSGQYWKGLGLLVPTRGEIQLTLFGRKVADGTITPGEFATAVVAGLELPNPLVQSEEQVRNWKDHGIKLRPLSLLLSIMERLGEIDSEMAYLTKNELVDIVQPISSMVPPASIEDYADTLIAHREQRIDTSTWPSCSQGANDARMAREFLLFLSYYGFCEQRFIDGVERFVLTGESSAPELSALVEEQGLEIPEIATSVTARMVSDSRERRRVLREVLERPEQAKFRKNVLCLADERCLLTGAEIRAALEAAHIVPVSEAGSDSPDNGLCLRSDLHSLFDAGHIRLKYDGSLHYSDSAKNDPVYRFLPAHVDLPPYVKVDHVVWRWNYR